MLVKFTGLELDEAYLNQSSVNQDTSADGVEHTADNARGHALRVVRRAYTETNGDTEWGRNAVEDGSNEGDPAVPLRELHVGKTGTKSEALKGFYTDCERPSTKTVSKRTYGGRRGR